MIFRKRRSTNSAAGGTNANPNRSKVQRVVDGAKILLDIAKESSDWFPPLKSALGGVSALVNHYEQYQDVKEKIKDLKPQLDRLKQNITTTAVDGDPGETERRKELTSALEVIEKRSQALLEKGKIRGGDSGEVVKLVEGLRDAITRYQVSQQQAIYEQIKNLTSSFDILLRIHEKSTPLKNKLDSTMARLVRLQDDDGILDESRHEQRAKLFNTLRLIGDAGNVLHDRMTTEGYEESQDDIQAVSRIAEDIRDALLDYQMAQQQAIYDQNCKLIDAADLSVLDNRRRAQGAEHRHGDRRGCLKGTREAVLDEIESWAEDSDQSPVFWLNGLAGTGKSTIAQTVSERMFADGKLGASFFCSRDFEDRSDLHFIFPTLAFQLAYRFPEFRSVLVPFLRLNPDVAYESLYRQMEKLIVEPLQSAGVSTVIVIDALDECKDEEPSSAILSVLARFVGRIPEVKFLITGRPEPRIRTGFRLSTLVDLTAVFVLHDVDPPLIDNDIRLFLKHELSELAQRRRLGKWPSDKNFNLLCSRAAGLFAYAAATVKFLDSDIRLPKHQLDAIVKLPESTAPVGKTPFSPKTSLDSLYTSILQTAFSEGDPEVYSRVRSTIGAVVLVVNPLPPSGIAELVGLDPDEVILYLTWVQSLLILDEDSDQPVKPFHKSFPDFITDPSRCTDTRFYVSLRNTHLELAMDCLRMMNEGLEQNLLSFPNYALNSEVEGLETRIEDQISIALEYACRSWHSHLAEAEGDTTDIVCHLRIFLEEKFLAWLEIVSAVGAMGGAVVGLEKVMYWLQEVAGDEQLLDITKDYLQFVTTFFEVINVSAIHVYHSALELSPVSSIVRKLYYHRRITRRPEMVIGTLDSWDRSIGVFSKNDYHGFCTWSSCGQFVAAQKTNVVEVRNQLTLELIAVLRPPETILRLKGPLAYSPDGRFIACSFATHIIIWDIQTGGVAKEIKRSAESISLVWSSDGGTICTIEPDDPNDSDDPGDSYDSYDSDYSPPSSDSSDSGDPESDLGKTYSVHTYDISSGTTSSPGTLKSSGYPYLWVHDGSFWIMTMQDGKSGIDTFKVGPTLIKIRSFDFPPFPHSAIGSFSPTTHRVSISGSDGLRIFDIQSSNLLLDKANYYKSRSDCFSSDGNLFAASHWCGVHIWKYASGCYTLCGEFGKDGCFYSIQFSPTPLSILTHSRGVLHVFRLHELPTTPQTHHRQHVGLSRSGTHIATAHELGNTITIIDLLARSSPQFIDTDMEIARLALTGNVLLVAGSGRTVAWLLTEDGLVDGVIGDRRVSRRDSIWTISEEFGWKTWVGGQVGAIELRGDTLHVYHTETGEVLDPNRAPPGYPMYRYYSNMLQPDTPPEDSWQTSRRALREGWVKDPEGKHRLWVPVKWRDGWDRGGWSHNATTQFNLFTEGPVIIKF